MPQILASGKTGANKYDLRQNDPTKVFTRLDARQLAQSLQKLFEFTQGYSLSGDEGSAAALNEDLSIIDVSNIATFSSDLTQALQTLVAARNLLTVDPTSTANALVLIPKKIGTQLAPDGEDYTDEAPLPFIWEDDLTFGFRAIATNTDAMTAQIAALAGLSGSISIVDEQGAALPAGAVVLNKYYEIVTKTISTVKKLILKQPSVPSATTTNSGSVELLTDAELAAGTDATRAATAAAIASLFGASVRSATGYARLPIKNSSGAIVEIILQWGFVAGATTSVTFPIAFPNAFFAGFANDRPSSAITAYSYGIISPSTTGMTISRTGSAVSDKNYLVIGY